MTSTKIFLISVFMISFFTAPCQAMDTLTFSWLPNPEPVTKYRIHYGDASRVYTEVHEAGLPEIKNGRVETTVDVSKLTNGVTYYYACTALNGDDESGYSEEIAVVKTPEPGDVRIESTN